MLGLGLIVGYIIWGLFGVRLGQRATFDLKEGTAYLYAFFFGTRKVGAQRHRYQLYKSGQ